MLPVISVGATVAPNSIPIAPSSTTVFAKGSSAAVTNMAITPIRNRFETTPVQVLAPYQKPASPDAIENSARITPDAARASHDVAAATTLTSIAPNMLPISTFTATTAATPGTKRISRRQSEVVVSAAVRGCGGGSVSRWE